VSRETTVLPARDTALLDAAEALLRFDGDVSLEADGASVALPPELRQLLADVVKTMRRGQAVTLAPLGQQLTTQKSADLLGISRPTLIKLLEQGYIPYETPGRHRRLRLNDVLAFQQLRRDEQRQALKDLAAESQELGLYDAGPETFEAALSEGRRMHA
jgi:excisionase family DNA binding protein